MKWQVFRNGAIALAATGALVGPVLLPGRAAATLPGRDGLIAWDV
jgi:hypothetical protein